MNDFECKSGLDAEREHYFQEDCVRHQDNMEARGGPDHQRAAEFAYHDDFCPF